MNAEPATRKRSLVRPPFRVRPIATLALLAALFLPASCITCAMWQSAQKDDCPKAAAVALTPVTVAVDAALFAGYVWLASGGGAQCQCSSPPPPAPPRCGRR